LPDAKVCRNMLRCKSVVNLALLYNCCASNRNHDRNLWVPKFVHSAWKCIKICRYWHIFGFKWPYSEEL